FGSLRSSRMSRGRRSGALSADPFAPNNRDSASAPSRALRVTGVNPADLSACSTNAVSSALSSTRSKSIGSGVMLPASLEREVEDRPLAFAGFRPDAAAMALDDPLHYGQADAGAFKIFHAVQALKHAEEFLRILHVKARPVVLDKIDDRR